MSSQQRIFHAFIGGLIGFILSIFANLVSDWWLKQTTTGISPTRSLLIVLILTSAGLLIGAWWNSLLNRENADHVHSNSPPSTSDDVQIRNTRLWGSKLKTRGQKIQVDKVSSFGSSIDIDSGQKGGKK